MEWEENNDRKETMEENLSKEEKMEEEEETKTEEPEDTVMEDLEGVGEEDISLLDPVAGEEVEGVVVTRTRRSCCEKR